jgi:hypothetical protein
MGLSVGQRKAVTKAIATRYRRASKADKSKILDELCATTGWHRNQARKALATALRPKLVPAPRRPRTPVYGPEVLAALRFCWAVLGAPTGKRLAPMMTVLVPALRRFGELEISDELAALLVVMSPATMDRRLGPARAAMSLRGRSHTKPGSLLKSQIPIRTWAQSGDAVPGFVEIDLVGHEGGNAEGEHCYTLTATDISTGWTENRSVITNYFLPQQKLISKVRGGAKVTKKYAVATTPHRRAQAHSKVTEQDKTIMTDILTDLNPAAVQRQIQALTTKLLTLTTSKAKPRTRSRSPLARRWTYWPGSAPPTKRLLEQAEQAPVAAITRARQNGATWAEIGTQLGITSQGAQQRFTRASLDESTKRATRAH